MKTTIFRCLFAAWVMAILGLVSAFSQTITGSITGVVTDPSGAVVVGAKVTAQNTATGVQTTVQTNGLGLYTIRFLPIGPYTVEVEAKGFSREKVNAITLEINQTAKVNIAL